MLVSGLFAAANAGMSTLSEIGKEGDSTHREVVCADGMKFFVAEFRASGDGGGNVAVVQILGADGTPETCN